MTTPADWYPDPEDPASLRYWDGTSWTEHRAPAYAPPAPAEAPAVETPAEPQVDEVPASEQATSVVSLPEQPTTGIPAESGDLQGGAHRAPDGGREPISGAYTPTPSQPYEAPTYEAPSYETPSYETPSYEAPSYGAPSYGSPTSEPPAWEAPPSGQLYPPASQPYEASSFAPPPGSQGPPPGSSGGPNKKLIIGILGAGVAVLVAIVLVVVFVVMKKDEPTVTASPTTSSSKTSTSKTTSSSETTTEPSTSETLTPPPNAAQGTDGDYNFSVTGTESGDTITSTVSDDVQAAADGMFYVVHLNVTNTGTTQQTFVAMFQTLNAGGQTYSPDDAATALLGGTIAMVDPGAQADTAIVYDVPVGTEPESIQLHAEPSTPGVVLPLQ